MDNFETIYNPPWVELHSNLLTETLQDIYEIIDDGLANGFEFTLINGRIYYREK